MRQHLMSRIAANNVRVPRLIWALAIGLMTACASPGDARDYLAAGDEHFSAGHFREAVIEYRNAVQADPKLGVSRVKLAAVYEIIGEGGLALEEYIRAADLLPHDINSQLTAGKYLLAARRTSEALARADAVLALKPDSVEGHILRGNALGGLNELDNALAEMEEALRLDPSSGITYTQLGLVEAARGHAPAAETAFKKAIELAPNEVGGHLALANYYWSAGRLPEAEKSLESAFAIDPNEEGTNRALAVFALATRRTEQAEKYLRRISELSKAPSSTFALAEYYIATQQASRAIALLEPLISEPRATGAKQHLARAYAADRQVARAQALIAELLAANPRDAATLLLKSQILLDEGQRDAALPIVKSAVAADSASMAAQFTLGRVYAARGDHEGAKAAFREVLKQTPSATAARVELANIEVAQRGNNAAASVQAFDAAPHNRPGSIEATLALVRALLVAKQFDRADTELQRLLQIAPDAAAVHVQLGVLAASRNNTAAATLAFETGLALDANSIDAFAGLVALDLNRRDFAAATSRVEKRLAAGAPSGALLLLAARTYVSADDLAGAEQALKQAIEKESTLLPAYELLAQVYVRQDRLHEARAEFDKLAAKQSAPAASLTMSGLLLQASGNNAEARKRFEAAVRADDRAFVAANNLAWLYADSGENLGEALRLARAAAEAVPGNADVLDTLGWTYLKSSLPALAIAPLTRAVAIDPNRGAYQYRLGLAYARSGDPDRGRTALNRAIALDAKAPWVAEARRVLGGLHSIAAR
jgi:tetratricopeptide (TPR) repeat protein